MASICPCCHSKLSVWSKVRAVSPLRYRCSKCGSTIETKESLPQGILSQFVGSLGFIFVGVESWNWLPISPVSPIVSCVLGSFAYVAVVIPVAMVFGKMRLKVN